MYVGPQHLGFGVRVVRTADVQTSSVPTVRGVGLAFLELSRQEKAALDRLIQDIP